MSETTSITSLEELQALFKSFGVDTIYFKALAKNQDNEKNQIYFGSGMGTLTNIFPGTIAFRSASESLNKRASEAGKLKIELSMNFAWITRSGKLAYAPDAKIIDYFQYPEVRFSGFVKGCKDAPRAIRRDYQDDFGKRILALGVTAEGVVVGFLLTEKEDPVVIGFPDLPSLAAAPILKVLLVGGLPGQTPYQKILSELRQIWASGWNKSVRLLPGATSPAPFSGPQGGGYTLEALLGVQSNSAGEPDKHGFEVKSFGSGHVSAMTLSGDLGEKTQLSFEQFVRKYGKKSKGKPRYCFTGRHRAGEKNKSSSLTMEISGYDATTFQVTGNVEVRLNDSTGNTAVGWSLSKLGTHWNKKHASAVYVHYTSRKVGTNREYRYGPKALIGEGTSVLRLIRALALGIVYYDPGDEVEELGTPKKRKNRPQWRFSTPKIKEAMDILYDKVTVIDLSAP